MRYNLVAVLLGVMAFVSCSRPASMQRVANVAASSLKNRVAPPDSGKYNSVSDARDWQNPYLRVQANGIDARPISTATETPIMSPRDVVAYLEKSPTIAWPYGLVVAVQENSLRNAGDDAPIKRNREELVRLLEEAGIKVDLWP